MNTRTGMRPTMRDIARAAGVPVSAVPLVLGNRPGVSPERRERVRNAARALGYEYSRPAEPPRPPRRRRLGLVVEARDVPIFTDFYYGEILVGIQAEAKRLGLSLWLHTFDPEAERIEDVAASARDEVDGLIVVSGGDMTDERIAHLESTDLPTVLVDNFLIGHDVHAVSADNFGAGYQATAHLLGLGHRRVGMITGPRSYRKFVHRHGGYMDALAAAGLAYDPALAPPSPLGAASLDEAHLTRLLALPPDRRPTGIVAVTDRHASRLLLHLRQRGVRAPAEVSVVGIGGVEEAAASVPPLTTVAIPRREMGVLGVQRLVELLTGSAPPPFRTVLYTALVVRESAGAVAAP